MAAGDLHYRIEEIKIKPGSGVVIVAHFGIEDRQGNVAIRAKDFYIDWPTFTSGLTAQDRTSLGNIKNYVISQLLALDPTNWGGAINDL